MQRLILDALTRRPGGDWACERDQRADWVLRYGGSHFKVADDIHDLRVVAHELASEHGWFSHSTFISPAAQATFHAPCAALSRVA